jgi:hypothetical protein
MFPSNTGTKQDSLSDAWLRARSIAASIKSESTNLRNTAQNTTVSAWDILDFRTKLVGYRVRLQQLRAVAGLSDYAKTQLGDAGVDLAADFTSMVAAIDVVLALPLPNDGTWLQVMTANPDGTYSWRQFNSAQTATLRTALTTLIGTID